MTAGAGPHGGVSHGLTLVREQSSAKANGTATMCLPLRLQGLAKGLASRGSQSGLRGGKMVTWRGPLCMVREGPAGAESTEHQRGESEPCWG